MRIFLKVSAIILALIIIAIVAATQLISTDDIVNQVSTKVEQATGRTLSVDGDKQLSFFPSLSIELNKVRFANAPFGSKPNMATVEALNIHIPWLSIFSGELTIDKFVIVNPDILLETTADGQVNWQFPVVTNTGEEPSEELSSKNTDTAAVLPDGFDVRLGQVEIQGGKLTILDHKNQTTKVVDQLSLAVLLPSLKETLTVSGSVRYMAKVFELESSITTPAHVINSQPFTVKLSMLSDLTNVNYAGEIKNKGQDIKGKLAISGDSVKQILAWQNMPLEAKDEAFNQFSLVSDMHFANNKLTLKDISVELDKLAFTGSSTITLSEPLTINADIDLGSLNLNPYLPPSTITEPTKPSTDAKSEASSEPLVWDDTEIDLSALGLINADLAIKSSKLLVREIKLGQNKLAINLHQGKAKINLLDFQAYQGQGTGTIEVLANKKPYQISSKFDLNKINAEPLLTDAAGFDKLMGKGQLTWNISTSGVSQKDFIAQLNGELNFSFIDGAIRGVNLAAIAKSANNIMTGNLAAVSLDSDFSHAEKTDFAALTGTFNISKGLANTNNISLHNPFIRVSGAGDIDLPQTKMKMHIVTEMVASLEGQAAQEASSGIKIPIKISGPFHQIKIRPDVSDQAKDKLKEKVKEKVKDKLKKLFG
ncbi:AsmA family protein [Colwellia sp. E150_009]